MKTLKVDEEFVTEQTLKNDYSKVIDNIKDNNTDKETDFEIRSHADLMKYLFTHNEEINEEANKEFIIEQILKSDYLEPIDIAEANNIDFKIKNHEDLIKYLLTHEGEVNDKFVIEQGLKNDYYSKPISNTAK